MPRKSPGQEPASPDASLEARLDDRLKAMFEAIKKERAPTALPDLKTLPRPRRTETP